MKILCLDYGQKRIGYAVGETELGIAFGREVIENKSQIYVLDVLKKLVQTEGIELLLVGLPTMLDGNESEQTSVTKHFAQVLEDSVNLPLEFADERLTSREAEKNLYLQNFKAKDQKGKKDVISAEIILQHYLDKIKS